MTSPAEVIARAFHEVWESLDTGQLCVNGERHPPRRWEDMAPGKRERMVATVERLLADGAVLAPVTASTPA